MRKLCTDEVGGVKMKKKMKKARFAIRKNTALVWLLLWLCISKMIRRA
jgi:hypothetical protein